MARLRALILIAVALAFGFVSYALSADAAKGGDAHAVQGHEDDEDDDDDDDDDGGGVITLERQPIAGRGPARVRYVPGELLVRFRPGTSTATIEAAAARAGGRVVGRIATLGVYVVKVPPARTARALASLRAESSVESVERDVVLAALDTIPNDVLWPMQWGLRLVGAPRAWDATTGVGAVIIAVLDTGVDPRHPDLAGAAVPGRDLVNDDADPSDDEGHGTSVGGVIAARTNNGEGQAGMCWTCSLMPVKVLDSTGAGKTSTVAAGIVWAVDHGARVLNMSWGSPGSTSALASAVAYAASKNAVLVAAAGNSGVDTPFYPAAYSEVIGVAATTETDARYSWSNYGSWVKVTAPGCNAAPRRDRGYIEFCGTSSAAPIVSGIAGLALSLKLAAPKSEVDLAIATNARPVPGVARFGRLQAPEAMTAVSPTALPPLAAPPPPPPPPVPVSAPPAAPAPSATTAPSNVKRPRVLGRARVGRTLRVVPGVWNPAPERFAYQWRRCRRNGEGCRTIRGARGRSYRLRPRDRGRRLRAVVIAVNSAGAVRAVTAASAVVRARRR
jgi:subtilisin family serine protease